MSEQHKALVRRLLEEVASGGDLDQVDEIVAPNFAGHTGTRDKTQGIEAYKQFLATLRAGFPDLRLTVDDQIAEGDKVVTRFTFRGTHQGTFAGVPPTGRTGVMTGVNVDRFAGGRIAECWSNSDDLGMLRQLGVIPEPAAAG